ncbi:MAG TPA: phospholipase D family protein [Rhizobiaceae bacterium]|nr:phospholipase D family protein [Rhizobiaceae bacterium]
MAKKEFLLQGFTERTHADALGGLFEVDDIERVLVSVAFLNEGGVEHVQKHFDPHGKRLTVFAGIRNDITSHQGLARMLGVKDTTLYAVDTGAGGVLFHPKLYLVRGKTAARLIIGSANLTLGGLNNNIEASIAAHFDLKDSDDLGTVDSIEKEFARLPGDYKDHIIHINAIAQLDEMLKQNRIADENLVRPPRPPASGGAKASVDEVPRITLKTKRIFRAVAKKSPTPAALAAGAVVAPPMAPAPAAPPPAIAGAVYKPIWQSKPLSARSLTVKSGDNTNPTGSTTLGKGLMEIDPVTYFRNDVFGHLHWETYKNRAGNDAERVNADFDLFIKGKNVGRFTLTLRHSLTRAAAAAEDKNLPTELSWNDAREYVARPDLLERTMTLLLDMGDANHFAVEID